MDELATLDREAFAQVWSRVAPQGDGPVEVVGPQAAPGSTTPTSPTHGQQEQTPQSGASQGKELQRLILACLNDASVYRDLNRRTISGGAPSGGARSGGPRSGEARPGGAQPSVAGLTELKNRKIRQAKRLSAAYFLISGVRYWPQEVTAVNPPEPFFPALRQRFLAEGRRAGELEALAGQAADPDLKELYADLAQETREMTRTIRGIVERET